MQRHPLCQCNTRVSESNTHSFGEPPGNVLLGTGWRQQYPSAPHVAAVPSCQTEGEDRFPSVNALLPGEFISIITPDKTEKGKDGVGAEQLPSPTGSLLCWELKGRSGAETAALVLPRSARARRPPPGPRGGTLRRHRLGSVPANSPRGGSAKTVAAFWGTAPLSLGMQNLPGGLH